MKVLLITPPRLAGIKESKGTVPVSLLHLSSFLRANGHEPYIYDLSVVKNPHENSSQDPLEKT